MGNQSSGEAGAGMVLLSSAPVTAICLLRICVSSGRESVHVTERLDLGG